jgi:hypothetical protein
VLQADMFSLSENILESRSIIDNFTANDKQLSTLLQAFSWLLPLSVDLVRTNRETEVCV